MEPGGLESRVTALEQQVRELDGRVRVTEHDAAAARVLAGAADRDVGQIKGELRDFRQATSASFNALREDLVDLRTHVDRKFDMVDQKFDLVTQAFDMVEQKFEIVEQKFEMVDAGFAQIRGKLDGAAAGQQHIAELLERLIAEQGDTGPA